MLVEGQVIGLHVVKQSRRKPALLVLLLVANLWLAAFNIFWAYASGRMHRDMFAWIDTSEQPLQSYLRSTDESKVPTNRAVVLESARNKTIAFVTFSHLSNTTDRFEDMVIGSLDTWLKDDVYFVVLTNDSKERYKSYCKSHSPQCEQVRPIFVDCPEGKFREGPCCKQEKGLLHMYENYMDQYQWFAFMDDDVYIRKEYLQKFVGPLPAESSNMILTSGREGKTARLGKAGFMRRRRAPYWCSDDEEFQYPWGQPVVYSRSALSRISNGLRLGGLVKQCVEYDVTHDVGNGLFHFMHQLPETRIFVLDDEKQLGPEFLKYHAYHGVNKVMRMAPKRTVEQFNMSAVHTRKVEAEQFHSSDIEYVFHHASGFRTTKTFLDHGDPATWTEWHTMPVADCAGPYNASAMESAATE